MVPNSTGIRIVLRHANPLTQAGLLSLLGKCPDFDLIDAGTGDVVRSGDLLLADYETGVRLAAEILNERAPMKVVIISERDRETDIRRALGLGVRAFILAQSTVDEVMAAVRAAHAGQVHLGPEVARRLAESVFSEALTAREVQVLQFVVDGLCNKEIASRLDLAIGTVKSHLRAVYAKLKVVRRSQAIAAAERRGILPPRDGARLQ